MVTPFISKDSNIWKDEIGSNPILTTLADSASARVFPTPKKYS